MSRRTQQDPEIKGRFRESLWISGDVQETLGDLKGVLGGLSRVSGIFCGTQRHFKGCHEDSEWWGLRAFQRVQRVTGAFWNVTGVFQEMFQGD